MWKVIPSHQSFVTPSRMKHPWSTSHYSPVAPVASRTCFAVVVAASIRSEQQNRSRLPVLKGQKEFDVSTPASFVECTDPSTQTGLAATLPSMRCLSTCHSKSVIRVAMTSDAVEPLLSTHRANTMVDCVFAMSLRQTCEGSAKVYELASSSASLRRSICAVGLHGTAGRPTHGRVGNLAVSVRTPSHRLVDERLREVRQALHLGLGSSRRVSDQSRITLVPGATGYLQQGLGPGAKGVTYRNIRIACILNEHIA
jgi:hypothetical protein